MKQDHVFVLWAKRTDIEHEFMEIFTTIEQLEGFLFNNPNVIKLEITYHELNPT